MIGDFLVKVSLIGDAGVGKTSIISQYLTQDIASEQSTEPSFYHFVTEEYTNLLFSQPTTVRLHLSDSPSGERSHSLSYCHDVAAVILVCDVTKRESFENLAQWMQDISKSNHPLLGYFLVANKCDLKNRCVNADELDAFAKQNVLRGKDGQIGYFEVSAKDNASVREIFHSIGFRCISTFNNKPSLVNSHILGISLTTKTRNALEYNPPSLMEYRELRANEMDILAGVYPRENKLRAVDTVLSILDQARNDPAYYLSDSSIQDFRLLARGPLCEGRLSISFARALFPRLGVQPLISNQTLLKQLRLEFAIGIVREYRRERATDKIDFLRFFIPETLRTLAGKKPMQILKIDACADIERALLGEKSIAEVESAHTEALGNQSDRLGA